MENTNNLITSIMNNIFSFPFVIIIVILMFRKEIKYKLLNATKLKVGNIEAEFPEGNKTVKKTLKKVNENKYLKHITSKVVDKNILHKSNIKGESVLGDYEQDNYTEIQPDEIKFEDPKNSDNPKIAIPCIYADIEKTVKEKFKITDSSNMFINLLSEQKINNDTYLILDTMKTLRDNILLSNQTKKITKDDIDDYKENADGIIKIIKEI